jgi:hypothetical protein
MGLKETASMLWARRRTEYVAHDAEPPSEWRSAPRPSGVTASTTESDQIEAEADVAEADVVAVGMDGIEVVEQTVGVATVIETHYRIRCDCGRRWWAMDLEATNCPRCHRWVSIRPGAG